MSKHIPNRTQDRESARCNALAKQLKIAERRLVRAQNAWQKAREAVKRFEAAPPAPASKIGGNYDWTTLEARANALFEAHSANPKLCDQFCDCQRFGFPRAIGAAQRGGYRLPVPPDPRDPNDSLDGDDSDAGIAWVGTEEPV